MSGRLLSVNVAVPGTLRLRGHDVRTGIFKRPVEGRVRVGRLGLEGDMQADLSVHGGPNQAIYLYPAEHYDSWRGILARGDLEPGFFGENFTAEGVTEEDVRVGDVFRAGTAAVQVTKPRSPCFKLGARVGTLRFVRTFLESGRLGYYLRVLEEGEAGAGDSLDLIDTDPRMPTLAEVIGS